MALREIDKLELSTPLGRREIQLLLGDITWLPVEQKVDVVFTSAFHADYKPVQGTLIGSLKDRLDISVLELAKQKELDLRETFSCWMSAPLHSALPYRRVVCFEYFRGRNLSSQLSEVFRAMMPIFNNHETTVITPLLATGDQHQSMTKVLSGMVDGACEWIKAGLPLCCLKIVMYSEDPSHLSDTQRMCKDLFTKLRKKWNDIENELEVTCEPHDVCLSYSHHDKKLAEKIVEGFKGQYPKVRIYSDPFVFDHKEIWQRGVYSVMKNSKKIIIILTPAYLADVDCVEQFNMALCCNRLKRDEVVVPFYMETVESFPSYMSLVQHIDCRVSQEGESAESLIDLACASIITSLEQNVVPKGDLEDPVSKALAVSRSTVYDILISYSHRNAEEPAEVVNFLQKNHPDLNVFFDKSELKAGNLWQQALFEAVDKARCVVAFFSPGYIQSPVCNEEFNIALARWYAHDPVFVVPISSSTVKTVPRHLNSVPCVDFGQDVGKMVLLEEKLVDMVSRSKESQDMLNVESFKQKLEEHRAMNFKKSFQMKKNSLVKTSAPAKDVALEGEVVFSYAQDCLKLAAILSVILKQQAPKLVCHVNASCQSQRRILLESADMVVIFISDEFVSTQPLVEELHTVLCRQRTITDSTIVYLIQCNHKRPRPFYFHALPFSVSMNDSIWKKFPVLNDIEALRFSVNIDGMQGTYRCTGDQSRCLTSAAQDVSNLLSQRGTGSRMPVSIINFAQVENELKGIEDDHVDIHQNITSLDSVEQLMRKGNSKPSSEPEEKVEHSCPPETC